MGNIDMDALVLHGIGDLRYETVERPIPEKGEVLIKIKACGICSSDIPRIYVTGTYHFPTIPGHEFAGEIIELGEGCDNALLGRRAAVYPLLPCKNCGPCRNEEYAQCRHYNYFGSRCNGAFAQYLAVPVWNLVLFDDSLDYKVAALCEPSAVSLHAFRLGELKAGQTVAIIGTGTIAFLIASFARLMGASDIVICGRSKDKLEFAGELGYKTVSTAENNVENDVGTALGGEGADLVFECVGKASTAVNAIEASKAFSRVIFVGNPEGDIAFPKNVYWKILRQQITVKGTWNSSYGTGSNDWKDVLSIMNSTPGLFEPLITHVFKLEDYQKALNTIRSRSCFSLKVMFVME